MMTRFAEHNPRSIQSRSLDFSMAEIRNCHKRRHSHHGCQSPSILIIGDDLLWQILKKLDIVDIMRLRISCKRLHLLTQPLGKHMFYKFILLNDILLTDKSYPHLSLSYQFAKSPFQDVMFLAHKDQWWSQLELMYLQYVESRICIICKSKDDNCKMINTNNVIHYISSWHISICSICIPNCIYSKQSLTRKHPRLAYLLDRLLPFKSVGIAFYFYPCFLLLINHTLSFSLTSASLGSPISSSNSAKSCNLSESTSNLPNLMTPSTSWDSLCIGSINGAKSIRQIWSLILTDSNSWLFDNFNNLCFYTKLDPLYLFFSKYPTTLLNLITHNFINVDHANNMYHDLNLYYTGIVDLDALLGSIPLDNQFVSLLVIQVLDKLVENQYSLYYASNFIIVGYYAFVHYPDIPILTSQKLMCGPLVERVMDMRMVVAYMEMLEYRLKKVLEVYVMPVVLPSLCPNFNRTKHLSINGMGSVNIRLMHWIYDKDNGGNTHDLMEIIDLARVIAEQDLRFKRIDEIVRGYKYRQLAKQSSKVYFEHVYLLLPTKLEMVVDDLLKRLVDLENGDKCSQIVHVIEMDSEY
eukprot:NODE_193_length_15440_cov_0.478587.p3 type:complete len:580 gc:universal NODE_193_length_15440_cov_0.478587:15019-13280(-)